MTQLIRKIGYTLLSRHFYTGIAVGITLALFALPQFSLAYSYSRNPSDLGGTYDEMSFGVDATDLVGGCSSIWNLNFHTDAPSEFQSTEDYPVGTPVATFHEVFSNSVNVVYVFFSCDRASEPQNLEGDGATILWTTTPFVEPTASTSTVILSAVGSPESINCITEGTGTLCSYTYATSSAVRTEDMFYLTILFLTGAGVAIYLVRKLT